MKKFLTLALATVMTVACALGAAAGWCDSAFMDAEFEALATYGTDVLGTYQMRGFAVDPNGKYFFGGNLQGGPTMYKFNPEGEMLDSYQFTTDPGSYVKAIAVDDRGYVYNGIANAPNNGSFFFSICDMETLDELSYVEVKIDGKIGVNGVGVANVDGKYIMALICNYDTNRLYFYDVTDVKNPTEICWYDLPEKFAVTEGGNCAMDSKGNVYFAALKYDGNRADCLVKANMDGETLDEIRLVEPWGVSMFADEYVVVGCRDGANSLVHVIDAESMIVVGEYKPTEAVGDTGYSGVGIMNNRIYACDHSPSDTIYVSNVLDIHEKPAPVEETVAEVVDGAAAEGTAAAPATFDAGVIAAVAAVVSAAGYAISKKR
ncbi:MAG: hypothetical protein IJX14_01065 [Clostridia bacterium]|nr:hypothetical protein [Clostridia bacterium]